MMSIAVLAFLAGFMGANGFPHFVKGICKEEFANPFSASPLMNLFLGWVLFVLSGLLLHGAHVGRHLQPALGFFAVGALLAGVFQATIGAFGKQPAPTAR